MADVKYWDELGYPNTKELLFSSGRSLQIPPDDCDTRCIPISLLTSFNAVDFPLAVSPTAVGTGHEPVKINFIYKKNGQQ